MTRMLRPTSEDIDKIIVLLHGSHATGEEMVWIASHWRDSQQSALFAIPRATIPSSDGQDRVSWFIDRDAEETGLSAAALAINRIVDDLCEEHSLLPSRVVLVGYSQGMTVAFEANRLRTEQVGLIIGFGGVLPPDISTASQPRPDVLLVHGEQDNTVPFSELMKSEGRLRAAGYTVVTLPLQNVGHWVDPFGAAEASGFIKDKLDGSSDGTLTWEDFRAKAKLLIWDLDETLWAGTLAENDQLTLFQNRADIVRRLNEHGIVSSICSKNDFAKAKDSLVSFGIWDQFVFPRIDFRPKGEIVKALLEEMQLRPQNTIFIDDNLHNLEEVKAVCPGVWTIDARDANCDVKLADLVDTHKHVQKRRVDTYKALESKSADRESTQSSPEDFLRSCNIQVAVAWRADVMEFSKRIEELINRTNQLNFMKSRVAPGAMDVFLAEPMLRESFAIFVWDKYGYHGLIGFVGVDIPGQQLIHMTFSCRIMHMGIEEWVLDKVLQRFPDLKLPENFPIRPFRADWINEKQYTDEDVRSFILQNEKPTAGPESIDLRIMANCQSGALAHFAGLEGKAEIDNFPRIFNMFHMLDERWKSQNFPKYLVYGVYTDFFNDMWPEEWRDQIDKGLYRQACSSFANMIDAKGCHLLVIPTPDGIPEHMYHPQLGITSARANEFKAVWIDLAVKHANIEVLPIEDICLGSQMLDDTHFSVDATRKLANWIKTWVEDAQLRDSAMVKSPTRNSGGAAFRPREASHEQLRQGQLQPGERGFDPRLEILR